MTKRILSMVAACAVAAFAQGAARQFSVGADVGWVTELEKAGCKFVDSRDHATGAFALLKLLGFDAVRIRVWVNPADGWNALDDVLVKARRAARLKMPVMLDFHYSDTWADPGSQTKPEAWKALDAIKLCAALARHTATTLKKVKSTGAEIRWVQIGNEIRSGMLWDLDAAKSGATWDVPGKAAANEKNFVRFLKAGALAVRRTCPKAKIVIHCDKGEDQAKLMRIAELVKSVDYDIFGVSLYPETGDWREKIDACMKNLAAISKKYPKPTMVCEFGMRADAPDASREAWRALIASAKALPSCQGVFYWEPLAYGGWHGYWKGAAVRNGDKVKSIWR